MDSIDRKLNTSSVDLHTDFIPAALYQGSHGPYYTKGYPNASDMSDMMSSNEQPIAEDQDIPVAEGQDFHTEYDQMHQEAHSSYPSNLSHPIQANRGHSNLGPQGSAIDQATFVDPLSQVNPQDLFHRHEHFDNNSMGSTLENHHMVFPLHDTYVSPYPPLEYPIGESVSSGGVRDRGSSATHRTGVFPNMAPPTSSSSTGRHGSARPNYSRLSRKMAPRNSSSSTGYRGSARPKNTGVSTSMALPASSRSMGDRVSRVHHNEERGESSRVGGRACLKGRGKVVNLEKALVADRLWNFEASHENTSQQDAASEPLLSNDQFLAAVQQPYDPLWIDNHGLDRSKLTIQRSNLKFEKLFLDSVLTVGDILVLGDMNQGIQENLRNTALVGGFFFFGNSTNLSVLTSKQVIAVSKLSNWWPDLQMKSVKDPSGYRVLARCKGTQDLAKALVEEDDRLQSGFSGAWKLVSLFRNGENLGTLAKIRDEYGFWIDQVDEWAASNNQRRRARRCPRGSGLLWHNSKFYQAMPDGSYEPLDDAYQLNPVNQHHNRGPTL